MDTLTPTMAHLDKVEERAWDEAGTLGRVCADLLTRGDVEGARVYAARCVAQGELWREFFHQKRDLRRLATVEG